LYWEKENSDANSKGERIMLEEIFFEILNSSDGDYVIQAMVLAEMKPNGW
jgi:hypothetical protein